LEKERMTKEQENLLLSVARILRVRIKEDPNDPLGSNRQDYHDLCEALLAFDPVGFGEDLENAQTVALHEAIVVRQGAIQIYLVRWASR
jgi:hypothetical protein